MYEAALELLKSKLVCIEAIPGHGYEHFAAVANHTTLALEHEQLAPLTKFHITLASWLHDVDDDKITKTSNTTYSNARILLEELMTETVILIDIEFVLQMIALVSCRFNKSTATIGQQSYMFIPRDSDRLEAIGAIGIKRCYEYSSYSGRPVHTAETPRVSTLEELKAVASNRFETYNGNSVSTIDHFYDKIVHIGRPENLKSNNPYILAEAKKRTVIVEQHVLDYWSTHI